MPSMQQSKAGAGQAPTGGGAMAVWRTAPGYFL